MKFLFIKMIIAAMLVPFTYTIAHAQKQSWQQNMQQSAKTLLDGFPYIYSPSEFKNPKNTKKIMRYIKGLKNASHTLPAKKGQAFLGLEPLIHAYRSRISKNLETAEISMKEKNYESAHKQVINTIHKCFACHTAYQLGPHNQKINSEVKNLPLDAMSKAEVLVAIRQFNASLWIIENELEKKISGEVSGAKAVNQKIEKLLKMHLLISVRAIQNITQAKKAISLANKKWKSVNKKDFPNAASWQKDLDYWSGLNGSPGANLAAMQKYANKKDSYVANLLVTYLLHKSLGAKKKGRELAATYKELMTHYKKLGSPILSDLPVIYKNACQRLGIPKFNCN